MNDPKKKHPHPHDEPKKPIKKPDEPTAVPLDDPIEPPAPDDGIETPPRPPGNP